MHNLASSFVLGFHGCDRDTAEKLLQNEPFQTSENDYDWLGSGIYFWEANPDRALEWARKRAEAKRKASGEILEPFVVGAVIDLGFCLDLISSNGSFVVEQAYADFQAVLSASGAMAPVNTGGNDNPIRKLDCAVINFLHESRRIAGKSAFDTVRGLFDEGKEIYPGSGFKKQTHVQICVRNPANIHGVFRVPHRYFTNTS